MVLILVRNVSGLNYGSKNPSGMRYVKIAVTSPPLHHICQTQNPSGPFVLQLHVYRGDFRKHLVFTSWL